MAKLNCLVDPTNVSYQCILLCCMVQAHANGWGIKYEWFDGFGLIPIGLFTRAQPACAKKWARDTGGT